MITTLSKRIVNLLISVSNTNPESEKVEIYVYGLECLLNTGITIFILFIWSLITNTLLETSCWLITFSILRHHSGGLHAPTQFSCITSSCLLGISNWLILKLVSYQLISASFICVFCIVICTLYAPTDTSKYELTIYIRKKEKICSLLILIKVFIRKVKS